MRSDVRENRKKLTAANMTLTPDEASKFWPIYDQYIQETIKINDERWALIQKYAANYSTMTDELAQQYIMQSNDVDQRLGAPHEVCANISKSCLDQKDSAVVPG